MPLPPELRRVYGRLTLPLPQDRPWVVANLASTLDGVANFPSLAPARAGEVAGGDANDRFLLGLLRSLADYVVVGAGTLRSAPRHSWLPGATFPSATDHFDALRASWGRHEPPIRVFVSGRGDIDLSLPVFRSGVGRAIIVTGPGGAERLAAQGTPSNLSVLRIAPSSRTPFTRELLRRLPRSRPGTILLLEGGPRLLGEFLEQRTLDELFLTLALRFSGNRTSESRTHLVEDVLFSPERTPWGELESVRRHGPNLFLRLGLRSPR